MQEINNAVANAMKEIAQRYDFKGSISNLETDIISLGIWKLLNSELRNEVEIIGIVLH